MYLLCLAVLHVDHAVLCDITLCLVTLADQLKLGYWLISRADHFGIWQAMYSFKLIRQFVTRAVKGCSLIEPQLSVLCTSITRS